MVVHHISDMSNQHSRRHNGLTIHFRLNWKKSCFNFKIVNTKKMKCFSKINKKKTLINYWVEIQSTNCQIWKNRSYEYSCFSGKNISQITDKVKMQVFQKIKYVVNVFFFVFFLRKPTINIIFCSRSLHLFDQNDSKNSQVQYYNNLK